MTVYLLSYLEDAVRLPLAEKPSSRKLAQVQKSLHASLLTPDKVSYLGMAAEQAALRTVEFAGYLREDLRPHRIAVLSASDYNRPEFNTLVGQLPDNALLVTSPAIISLFLRREFAFGTAARLPRNRKKVRTSRT